MSEEQKVTATEPCEFEEEVTAVIPIETMAEARERNEETLSSRANTVKMKALVKP